MFEQTLAQSSVPAAYPGINRDIDIRACAPKQAYKLAERALRKLGLTSTVDGLPNVMSHLMRSIAKLSG